MYFRKNTLLVVDAIPQGCFAIALHPARSVTARELKNREVIFAQPLWLEETQPITRCYLLCGSDNSRFNRGRKARLDYLWGFAHIANHDSDPDATIILQFSQHVGGWDLMQ